MKVGFGQGIALIQIDRTFARHGVFGRFEVRRVAETARRRAEIRHGMRAGFLHHERLRAFTRCTQLGGRLTGDVGVFHQPTHGAVLVLIPPHCSEPESAEHDDQQRNGRPPILGHPIDPRSGRRRLILDRRRGRRSGIHGFWRLGSRCARCGRPLRSRYRRSDGWGRRCGLRRGSRGRRCSRA